jgi:predicted aconitase with swiveling domain
MFLRVKVVNEGIAKGPLLISSQPISFFGGVDLETGIVVEKNHPLEGKSISKKILVLPSGKGSTVGSYVVYGLAKKGTAPSGIIMGRVDSIISAGAILAGIPLAIADIRKICSFFKDGEVIVLDAKRGRLYRETLKE